MRKLGFGEVCGSPRVTLGLGPTWALSANAYLEANPRPLLSLFLGLPLSWHRLGFLQHGGEGVQVSTVQAKQRGGYRPPKELPFEFPLQADESEARLT